MDTLEDELNLRILRYLVSGQGVKVNISALSRKLDIHRATVRRRIESLNQNKILNEPQYPFPQLFQEYPLLILVKADIPRTQDAKEFYKNESNIFAAFSCMEGPYNTLLIEFFEDLESYHRWREQIIIDQKLPSRFNRSAAHVDIFSNKLTFKYNPNCFIKSMEKEYDKKGSIVIGGKELDDASFNILKNLANGECIRTNDSFIARELGSNRKTVKRRINNLLNEGIIDHPKCYFPNLFVPPEYNLVVTMIEVKTRSDDIKKYIKYDNHVSRAIETSTERYNILLFSAFQTIEDFFDWGEKLNSKFPGCIGAISNTILSSRMIHTINPQKVSLGWIERKLWEIKQK